ncbi:MAG: hypothetical protein AAGD05_03165, partial [Bacteroidota bacterium]
MLPVEPESFVERNSDEISVKALIIRTRAYAWYLVRYWYLILLAAIPLAVTNFFDTQKIQATYNARTILLIRTNEPLKDNAIISQIFARLANSRNVIATVLLKPTEIDGREDLLINHYIATYQKHYPALFQPTIEPGFIFTKTDPDEFNQHELLVFDLILDKVTTPLHDYSDGFVTIFNDDKLGFIHVNISTPAEALSIKFNELLHEALDELYYQNV